MERLNHITCLEINSGDLINNLNFFQSKLKPKVKSMLVVKASAYGSSMELVAKILEDKASYFAVAYLDEGIRLRNAGIKKPILVLHPQYANLTAFSNYDLEVTAYNFRILEHAQKLGLKIHIKLNTGLNRLGFDIEQIEELAPKLTEIKSVFSHLAASEDLEEKAFTLKQIQVFKKGADRLKKLTQLSFFRHMSNTSAILNYPEAQFDMVRMGLGLHGFSNDSAINRNLKMSWTLKSQISQIRTVKKGAPIGYNLAERAQTDLRIGIIPVGHADGFSRQLGNGKGWVLINGQKAYTKGNICMDMILVDLSGIEAQEGSTVIIYENQETVNHFAKICNTIPYELLTAIGSRINRSLIS